VRRWKATGSGSGASAKYDAYGHATLLMTTCYNIIDSTKAGETCRVQYATGENPQPDPGPARQARRRSLSALAQRWLTAIIAMPIVLAFTLLGGWFAFVGVAVVVALGTYELHNMMHRAGCRPLTILSTALKLLFLIAAMFPQQRLLLLESGLSAALFISFLWLLFRKKLDGAMVDWALTLAIPIYLGWPLSLALLLRGYQVSWPLPPGAWWLLLVLLGTWGFDSAAFFFGRYFGRHKLAPSISPGKTWEGVLGGMLLSIVAALLFTIIPLGIPWYLAVLLGIWLGAAAVIGDLAESLIKRQAHVKDSGQFMRGHGGILDRIDSLLFVIIAVYVFAQLVGGGFL
jgi:phosphatidate cytidylyltransferase